MWCVVCVVCCGSVSVMCSEWRVVVVSVVCGVSVCYLQIQSNEHTVTWQSALLLGHCITAPP